MKNVDISRDSFDPLKNYSRVVKQQGRVELDSDWNEQASISLRAMRLMMRDLIGPYGGPKENCGFQVLVHGDIDNNTPPATIDPETRSLLTECRPGDFVLSRGHYYVDGLLCEVHRPFKFVEQPWCKAEHLLPIPEKWYFVYVDVWEQEVTSLEDEGIAEVALGGADTCARMRITWQISAVPVERVALSSSGTAHDANESAPPWHKHLQLLRHHQRGAMAAHARQTAAPLDLHSPGTEGRYRGLENQLYRVEIHRGGRAAQHGATFKWSRDNGIVALAVERCSFDGASRVEVTLQSMGRDDTWALKIGDVVEFSAASGASHALAGILLEITAIDGAARSLTLDWPLAHDDRTTPWEWQSQPEHTLVLRRWDHAGGAGSGDGAVAVERGIRLEEGRWLPIEDGIEIKFEPAGHGAAHHYRAGDYWLIPARVATGDVDWPRQGSHPALLPPSGVEHHYAPLAIVESKLDKTLRVHQLTRKFGWKREIGPGHDAFTREGV
jgi:hypothetical protein